jgi:hypothetical protein
MIISQISDLSQLEVAVEHTVGGVMVQRWIRDRKVTRSLLMYVQTINTDPAPL